eukprot:COSAG06_NODE_25033_length_647_cov_0.799270_2_plen_83_part_01
MNTTVSLPGRFPGGGQQALSANGSGGGGMPQQPRGQHEEFSWTGQLENRNSMQDAPRDEDLLDQYSLSGGIEDVQVASDVFDQ